ncbi:MAG: hypothetical protein HUJ30_07725 [Gammaproteobacteria bacterium]|nr:hypothetical protein [Gammaproteobacteria bacterium]
MTFSYYSKLNRLQKRSYDLSDEYSAIELENSSYLYPYTRRLAAVLSAGDRLAVISTCQYISDFITDGLGLPAVTIRVLETRPSDDWYELHGYYIPQGLEGELTITLWMKTAQRKQVVAFKTFLRTLLHELCHHIDYELLELEDSFHTEGFYQRESSLFHQIVEPLLK